MTHVRILSQATHLLMSPPVAAKAPGPGGPFTPSGPRAARSAAPGLVIGAATFLKPSRGLYPPPPAPLPASVAELKVVE